MAQSNRGRELRAAAALKRFETQQEETKTPKEKEATGDDTDYDETADEEEDEKTIDVGGGKFLVPVSGEEDGKAERDEMKRELLELAGGCGTGSSGSNPSRDQGDGKQQSTSNGQNKSNLDEEVGTVVEIKDEDETEEELIGYETCSRSNAENSRPKERTTSKQTKGGDCVSLLDKNLGNTSDLRDSIEVSAGGMKARRLTCSACSVVNGSAAVLCIICANVLEPSKMPNAWGCSSLVCGGSDYRNAGDAGICGVCGQRKNG